MTFAWIPRNVAEAYAQAMGMQPPDFDEVESVEEIKPLVTAPPAPRIEAWVRVARTIGVSQPRMVVEKREGPVILQVTDGVYFGSLFGGSSAGQHCWFVFWDEIISSTIPLSEAPAGHPLA